MSREGEGKSDQLATKVLARATAQILESIGDDVRQRLTESEFHGLVTTRVNEICEELMVYEPGAIGLVWLCEEVARLRNAVSFARSCIKSGEGWSDECEKILVVGTDG